MKFNLPSFLIVAAIGLGVACGGGDGKAKNSLSTYFKETEKKAGSGDGMSQMVLGKLYSSGEGTQQDKIQALKWMLISSRSANNPAKRDAEREAEELERELKPEEAAQARAAADGFKPTP